VVVGWLVRVPGRAEYSGSVPVDSSHDETDLLPPAADSELERSGSRKWRIVIITVVGLMVAMWIYVLYLAFGPGRQDPADRLDDPAFGKAGEARCAMAVEAVDSLPIANAAKTASERADEIDDANAIFGVMLDDLDGMAQDVVPAGDQRERATEWLADWRVLLGDREDYASRLRSDPDAEFLISEKEGTGRHITGWIDEFAKANKMPSCATPGDV
jgi:hypothetical protein